MRFSHFGASYFLSDGFHSSLDTTAVGSIEAIQTIVFVLVGNRTFIAARKNTAFGQAIITVAF